MNITVVGAGYVGLVTGTCFAELGNQVTCVDIDLDKVNKMKKGIIPIFEPDLDTIFKRSIKEGRLNFSTELKNAIAKAEIIFLALPTPAARNGSADLSYIFRAVNDITKLLNHYCLIVIKSTVPVGTADEVKETISKYSRINFDVVSNPEFLREGLAVSDFMNPDRIIVGVNSAKAKKIMGELYRSLISESNSIHFMDNKSAEMSKYAANSFLATKISFINEIANVCDLVGADVENVKRGIGSDHRIGTAFLNAGIGYGGSCFPKDVLALRKSASKVGIKLLIAKAATDVNEFQKTILVDKLINYFGGSLKNKTFAIWGLAFKPDTDDIRESASLVIINSILKLGANVQAYDPEAIANFKKLIHHKNLKYISDMYNVLAGTDALIIATEWAEFTSPNFLKMKKNLKAPCVFDGRNIYDIKTMAKHGFHYESIGRKVVTGSVYA